MSVNAVSPSFQLRTGLFYIMTNVMCRVWLTMNIMRMSLFPRAAEDRCPVWQALNGISASYWKTLLRSAACFKINRLVYEVTFSRCTTKNVCLLDVIIHLFWGFKVHYAKSVQKVWRNSLITLVRVLGVPSLVTNHIQSHQWLSCKVEILA